jgi:biopolymer transport protein ExbD
LLAQMLRVLVAISFAAIAACAQQESTANADPTAAHDAITVEVSVDATTCTVGGKAVPCAELPTYLSDSLQVQRSRSIVVSDSRTGRTDNGLSNVADTLHKAGYSSVVVVGFISEPE